MPDALLQFLLDVVPGLLGRLSVRCDRCLYRDRGLYGQLLGLDLRPCLLFELDQLVTQFDRHGRIVRPGTDTPVVRRGSVENAQV